MQDNKMSSDINVYVSVGDTMPAEKAIRKFKRLCDNAGIIKEYRRRKNHQKPSVKKKEKRENAEKRRAKLNRKVSSGRSKI